MVVCSSSSSFHGITELFQVPICSSDVLQQRHGWLVVWCGAVAFGAARGSCLLHKRNADAPCVARVLVWGEAKGPVSLWSLVAEHKRKGI